jgi:dTDP-4-dehydrorhamnose reductase
MKNVAIIGAGYLGRCVADQIKPLGGKLLTTYRENKYFPDSIKFDFFNDNVNYVFDKNEIDIIIIPAKIEFTEDEEALRDSMKRFLDYFEGKRIVYISSDGIFDGQKGMYKESEVPNPVSLYGKNLKTCEDLVREAKNHLIIRPSYIYGYSLGTLDGRLEKAKATLLRRERWESFSDMYKSPMNVNRVAEGIIKLAFSDYIGIVHVAGPRMSVFDFIREGMEAMNVETDNLFKSSMPEGRPTEFLPDTSLDSALLTELTGIIPLGVKESMEKYQI